MDSKRVNLGCWLKSQIKEFKSGLRVCVGCGYFPVSKGNFLGEVGINFLCVECDEVFRSYSSATEEVIQTLSFRSLYLWPVNEITILNKVVTLLKGCKDSELFESFARNHLRSHNRRTFSHQSESQAQKIEQCPKEYLIVPAPSRAVGVEDHASSFARAISNISGWKYAPLLERVDPREQKTQKLENRWFDLAGRFKLKDPRGYDLIDLAKTQVVFVDDLVTTGATACASYLALKKPPHFEVWTIFRRPSLRYRGEIDITRQ